MIIFTIVVVINMTACTAGDSSKNLVIPVSEISETAKFYPITTDGTRMEVVVLKASDGTFRMAFNTCKVCHGSPKAYFEQVDDTLKCQKCGNTFPLDSVGVDAEKTDGCNPIAITEDKRTVTDESITISYDVLKENTNLFPSNWKEES
jgi:uncharacterized membrane protein